MRGGDQYPDGMFSYRRPEERIATDHLLQPIRAMLDTARRELSPEFARQYPKTRRPGLGLHCVHQEPRAAAAERHRPQLFERVLVEAEAQQLLSTEHFTINGTLNEAGASLEALPLACEMAPECESSRGRRQACNAVRPGHEVYPIGYTSNFIPHSGRRSSGWVQGAIRVLHALLNAAIDDGLISANPAVTV